ncbi:MAG: aminotransferase class III-fold pyridoxal phosphate-dependent enzyme, partial [Hungatella sp.]
GIYLWEKLETFVEQHDGAVAHRGRGLIQGVEFRESVAPIVKKALLENQLILISAGAHIIRFVPPLILEEADVDLMLEKLEKSM